MSNGWKLELGTWADGTVRLVFWDSLEAKDRVFVLSADGTAARSAYPPETEENPDPQEVLSPVNLGQELRDLLQWLRERK